MRKIYSALDIGSEFIKLVVGEFINNKLNVLCAIKGQSFGFKNNQIINSNKLIQSINKVLNEASNKLNFKIVKVIVNIPTDYNEFILTENVLPIENDEGIVTSNDILKISKEASLNQIKPNDELIACVPVSFKVGDYETNKPLGKKGKILSLKSILVISDKKRIYDLIRIIEKCELEIVDITTTGLVDYYNFKNKELDKTNNIIVNMGATTTNISVFSKGIFINNCSLDMGGTNIDKELALKYNLNKKKALYLKENFALANSENANIKELIEITDINGKSIKVNQVDVSKVVNSKLDEMLKIVKKNINYLTKKEISYIIITGGLTELKDIGYVINKTLGHNKNQIGNCSEVGARNNIYSVALGMLKYFNSKLDLRGKDYSMLSDEDIKQMTDVSGKLTGNDESLIGKVFSYFFDN